MPEIAPEWLTLGGQVLTFLTALMAAVLGYINRNKIEAVAQANKAGIEDTQAKVKSGMEDTQAKVTELHVIVNSRLSELLQKTEQAAHSAGMAEQAARTGVAALAANPPQMTTKDAANQIVSMQETVPPNAKPDPDRK